MARSFGNNIAEQSGSLGLGDYFLDGAISGYRSFGDDFVTGDTPYYAVRNAAETKYEYNRGTTAYTSGAPGRLTRAVWLSSNANAAIDWQITDLPLIIYVPTPGEVLEGMVAAWVGTTRNPLIKYGFWTKQNAPSAGLHQINVFDGVADIPIITIDPTAHTATLLFSSTSGTFSGSVTTNGGYMMVDRTGDATAAAVYCRADAGQSAGLFLQVGSEGRWSIYKTGVGGEPGSNAGSDLFISSFDDNGVALNSVLYASRATGYVALGYNGVPPTRLYVRGVGQTAANFDPNGAHGATAYLFDTGSAAGTGGALMFGDSFGPFAAIKGYALSGTGPVGDLIVSLRKLGADATFTEALRIKADGTGIFTGTVFAPGAQIQMVSTQTGAVATGTTLIPADNTIPQQTEGDQYMTLAITPKSATSKLIIEIVASASTSSAGNNNIIAALFQDAAANALATAWATVAGAQVTILSFCHVMTSGTTSSTTFKVRLGQQFAGTLTFNGTGGAGYFGGVMASSIVIREVAT